MLNVNNVKMYLFWDGGISAFEVTGPKKTLAPGSCTGSAVLLPSVSARQKIKKETSHLGTIHFALAKGKGSYVVIKLVLIAQPCSFW